MSHSPIVSIGQPIQRRFAFSRISVSLFAAALTTAAFTPAFIIAAFIIAVFTTPVACFAQTTRSVDSLNLAPYAEVSTSFVSPQETLLAINSGYSPRSITDRRHGAYGNWPRTGTQWVEYRWSQPISAAGIAVYWWQDGQGVRLPVSATIQYWDGSQYLPVPGASAVGVVGGRFNAVRFPALSTDRLRLEFTGDGRFSTGILQWKVDDSGASPKFAPLVALPEDRTVIRPSLFRPHATVRGETTRIEWSKVSGPGAVTFSDFTVADSTAAFAADGEYVLHLSAANDDKIASADVHVHVSEAPATHLEQVFTTRYSIDSPLWSDRAKQTMIHWIPHCVEELSNPVLKEGGIENFIEAGNRNAGKAFKPHVGAPWADAYTHNTVEAMCVALQIDPRGDPEIISAQQRMRATLEAWIPIILAAQEPDGYLQTRFTLGMQSEYPHRPPRWTLRGEHEGYTGGYFIDAAIAHYLMTAGADRRMYDAAKRLADCWDANIGPPPKKRWADGHEEIEQALVRLARLVNQVEGPGKGQRYIALAKFLLSCRGGGGEYDQNQAPVTQQYYAAGHAVRAAYCYSAMADIAMETGDADYHTAVDSIWDDLVNRKYYVTGGIGSGETAEGFGPAFSLPNTAYCESCSGCGEVLFQHKMNLAHADAKYADLMEETLYNAVLGDVDLPAQNFTYTNPLDTDQSRYLWHDCPCCVGNIPRTLLMLPTWMYATGDDGVYVNLYIGSTVDLDRRGKPLSIQQITDYPRSGHIEIQINPRDAEAFAVYLRIPNRSVSRLYDASPAIDGISGLMVNGQRIEPRIANGYVRIERTWSPGDKIVLELPMAVQRIHADDRVLADRGKSALRWGPLVYTFESVDGGLNHPLGKDAAFSTRWEPGLLNGVTVIRGTFADGQPLTAIPYYARNNRGGRSSVWIADR